MIFPDMLYDAVEDAPRECCGRPIPQRDATDDEIDAVISDVISKNIEALRILAKC